jgi:hypothetical protein
MFGSWSLHGSLGVAQQVRSVRAYGCGPSRHGHHGHRGLKGGACLCTAGIRSDATYLREVLSIFLKIVFKDTISHYIGDLV